jgi:putative YhdH/YhfP family quinone oxidoreductase
MMFKDQITYYKALEVKEISDGFYAEVVRKTTAQLPENEVLIRVLYSSLNYKDALSISGHKGVTRQYPHVPGIDAAGEVIESANPEFKPGDEVVVTGYDLGMNSSGGFGGFIRVPAEWVMPRQPTMNLRQHMVFGTAGLTAALAVNKILKMFSPDRKNAKFLVTGASGGVGSISVALLSTLGFSVTAVTGKSEAREMLSRLGATEFLPRESVDDTSGKSLMKPAWDGAIDTVGGNVLATLLKGCRKEGVVASCGNVTGVELSTTVLPFILNGVNLLGIDSAAASRESRAAAWALLATNLGADIPNGLVTLVSLEELLPQVEKMLQGTHQGRTLVEHYH